MTTPVDGAALRALAGRVDDCADQLRERAASLVAAAAAARWQSTAADAFRTQIADQAAALHRVGFAVDEVARALRRHGRQAEIVQSAVRTPIDAVLSWLVG